MIEYGRHICHAYRFQYATIVALAENREFSSTVSVLNGRFSGTSPRPSIVCRVVGTVEKRGYHAVMNMFTVITSCFDAVPACDGRTDGQTDVQTDGFDSRFAVCIVSVTKMEELTKNVVYGQPATPILNGPNRIWFINVVTCRCRSISDEYSSL